MYVMPFWSFRRIGDHAVLTNQVTGQRAVDTWASVEALASLYEQPSLSFPVPPVSVELRLTFADAAAADGWLRNEQTPDQTVLPKIEQIELTNRCPYTCGMCPRTLEMDRHLGDMSLELFDQIMQQISGHTEFTALHHFGESLIHPRIGDAVAIALQRGVRTGLSCNPPSLSPRRAEAILRGGIANLVLSLDSLDPEVYRSIRGLPARIDLADRNLRELVRLRNEGGHDTNLTLQMISMRANQAEAAAFLEYCEDVGVDRGVVIRLERWDFDDEVVASIGEHTSPGYTAPCTRPWLSVAVLWDGRVVPCCHDYNGEVVLGDLRTDSLASIWCSPAAREFRDRNDEMSLCRKCAFGKTVREERRRRKGFMDFHRQIDETLLRRWEWFNPQSLDRASVRRWYDGFDVMSAPAAYVRT